MEKMQLTMRSTLALLQKTRRRSLKRTGKAVVEQPRAPHPIPKGQEHMACPITGLFADGTKVAQETPASAALAELEADPDIAEERQTLSQALSQGPQDSLAKPAVEHSPLPLQIPREMVPLSVTNGAHKANNETRRLVRTVGLPMLRRFTTQFYKRSFADSHIDQFIREHADHHGERFALWIMEKFGEGTPWTNERKTRPQDLMKIGTHVHEVAFDRSSAHFAAWHSPKRPAHKWGEHFKPDDARVWMRLHFWAAREVGLFEPQYAEFMNYYIRFIGHFISVYSGKSPPFTRESVRWSAAPNNVEKYLASGNVMADVIGQPVEQALAALPLEERVYTGSRHPDPAWPYDLAPLR